MLWLIRLLHLAMGCLQRAPFALKVTKAQILPRVLKEYTPRQPSKDNALDLWLMHSSRSMHFFACLIVRVPQNALHALDSHPYSQAGR